MMHSTPVVPVENNECMRNEKAALAPSEAWANTPCENQNGAKGGSAAPDTGMVPAAANVPGDVAVPSNEMGRKGMFEYTDAEAIKREVRGMLLRPDPYTVEAFYHETGIFSFIAKHPYFENVTLSVIAFNAFWIAFDTDWNKESSLTKSPTVFQVAEHTFCAYFSVELFVRFMAFKRKCDGLHDSWFVFDSLLVIFMVLETWVLTIVGALSGSGGESPIGGTAILRLFRLLRLSRLLRMLKSLPELMILIRGMITAMKSVLYVMCLLVIILYVFAIAFTQLATDTVVIKDRYFQNVLLSMYSLLIYGTFLDDLSAFCDDIRAESIPILVLVFVFICISALTVMNMLIGVLCEVVSAVAATEKEMILTQTVSEKMLGIVQSLDTNSNGMISFLEFRQILEIPQALQALQDVGVDPAGVVDFAEMIFFEDGDPNKPVELPFDFFMEMILDLRSSNVATVKDIKYMWRQISPKVAYLTKDVTEVKERTDRMQKTMDQVLIEIKRLGGDC